ncbi:MAG TPA: hypothetical protein VFM97_00055 [Gammaproteobacteria bacterium]|nr:hypothetical protein [Gammaproteobacteria bacterium]
MSVRIPISADPSGTVSAFNQITNAIRRAGQEGRRFENLDFSHPELKGFEQDLRAAQRNFEELQKTGRGQTASAVRAGKYSDVLDWYSRHGRQFPEKTALRRHRSTVLQYVTQGTRFEGGEEAPSGAGSGLQLPLPGMGKLFKGALAIAGLGGLAAMAKQGVGQAQDEAVAIDDLLRSINDTVTGFDGLRRSVEHSTRGMGLNYKESAALAQQFAKLSDTLTAQGIATGVNTSVGFSRSFGIAPRAGVGSIAQMEYLGAGSPRHIAMMFADAIASGKMFPKADEVMNSIASWVQASERVMVRTPNIDAYAALSSAMNAKGNIAPGLRGQAGAAILAQIDAAIRHGGQAGDAGQSFMWRALNNTGGRRLGPFRTEFLEEEGMFGTRAHAFGATGPGSHITNFQAALQEANRMYGNNKFKEADALKRLFGISQHQALWMMKIKPGAYGSLSKMLDKYGINDKSLNFTGIKDLTTIAGANDAGLEKLRRQFAARDDLTAEQKKAIATAKTPDALRKALAEAAASAGRQQTEGSKTRRAIADVYNALTDTGKPLISGVNTIKETAADILKAIAPAEAPTMKAAHYRGKIGQNIVGAAEDVGNSLFDKIPGHKFIGDILKLKNPFEDHKKTWHNVPMYDAQGRIAAPPAMPSSRIHVTTEVIHKDAQGRELGREKGLSTVHVPGANHG